MNYIDQTDLINTITKLGQEKVFDELIRMGYGPGNMPLLGKIKEACDNLLKANPIKE